MIPHLFHLVLIVYCAKIFVTSCFYLLINGEGIKEYVHTVCQKKKKKNKRIQTLSVGRQGL